MDCHLEYFVHCLWLSFVFIDLLTEQFTLLSIVTNVHDNYY